MTRASNDLKCTLNSFYQKPFFTLADLWPGFQATHLRTCCGDMKQSPVAVTVLLVLQAKLCCGIKFCPCDMLH